MIKDIDRIEIERNLRHKEQFIVWSKNNKVYLESKDTSLKVGDKVTFTNKYGHTFFNHEVLGFCEPLDGRFIYLDLDCYWIPVRQCEVKKVSL